MTCASSETSAIFTYSLQLACLSTGQVTCTAQVKSMGFMHATHKQVFGLASMVNFGQSDTTRMLTQVWDQLARRSRAGFHQVSDHDSIMDFGLNALSLSSNNSCFSPRRSEKELDAHTCSAAEISTVLCTHQTFDQNMTATAYVHIVVDRCQ